MVLQGLTTFFFCSTAVGVGVEARDRTGAFLAIFFSFSAFIFLKNFSTKTVIDFEGCVGCITKLLMQFLIYFVYSPKTFELVESH